MPPIYLELNTELKQVLDENEIDLATILQNQGIAAELTDVATPYQDETGVRGRGLTPMLILASGVSIARVINAISNLIETLAHRPVLVEECNLEEIRDAKGNVLLDKEGKPCLKKVKKHRFVEPKRVDSQQKTNIKGGGITIEFSFDKKTKDK